MRITYELAMAASHDAGNRSMREGKRTKWAVKDWNVAYQTFKRLMLESKRTVHCPMCGSQWEVSTTSKGAQTNG